MDEPYGDTVWTRLEPIARDDGMDEGLSADVHDPMWMLTRQWQLGEFDGEDAGSPVDVSVDLAFDHLSRYRSVGEGESSPPARSYDGGPLEPLVESEPVLSGERGPNARLAVQGGKTFLRLLGRHVRGDPGVDDLPAGYRLDSVAGGDEDEPLDEAGQRFAGFVEGRVLDGHTVYLAIDAALTAGTWTGTVPFPWDGDADWDGPSVLPVPDGSSASDADFRTAATEYHEWYDGLYEEPDGEDGGAWDPTRMEYDVRLSTGGPTTDEGNTETVLTTDQYAGGSLDWPDFSAVRSGEGDDGSPPLRVLSSTGDPSASGGEPSLFDGDDGGTTTTRTRHFLPTKVRFDGMPSLRYWEFEDADVRLDEIGSDDVSSQTLINFALVYGNDWYSFPVSTPLGTLSRVDDLRVTDTFGITDSVGPVEEDGWNAFSLGDLPNHDEPGLFLPPVLDDHTGSDPVERVSLSRDEMANLAFAVEERVEDPTGQPLDRGEYEPPALLVERVTPAPDVADESVDFRNPGREPLDVGGWMVTNGSDVFTFDADTVIETETTVTLHSGSEPVGEHSPTDFYWDAGGPVWADGSSETSVLSVYEPCGVDDHGHAVTPSTITGGSPPLSHLRLRKRIPLREGADLPTARYALATDLFDHWFALRPSAEEYVADVEDGEGPGDRAQYRYRHYLELALVLDAESLDAATVAQLPDPEGRILRPYPGDDSKSLRIFDEELHGDGTEITRSYRMATWTDGTTYLWSGRRATPGKGNVGSSTLRYDVTENWSGEDSN